MISTNFQELKNTLRKEPSGSNVKKEYWVGCHTKDDWEFIHDELKKDGSLDDNIPTASCECVSDCLQSDIRGVYLLTDSEVALLKNHSRVTYVHINAMSYPGTYWSNPDDIAFSNPSSKTPRYTSTVKHKKALGVYIGEEDFDEQNAADYVPSLPDNTLLNRGGYALKRTEGILDPWREKDENTIIEEDINQYGTGKDVDLIIMDMSVWSGHIEFQNPSALTNIKQSDNSTASTTSAPTNYIGTNVLKSGYSSSATTGSSEILDLLLDSPYYIDPAWFEADASNRLMTRWDGTTVPTETAAKQWWSDSSKRSNSFSSIGTIPSSSMTDYERQYSTGDHDTYPLYYGFGTHGTPCASLAYGRQYGWAYNANKWSLNTIGWGNLGDENSFDVVKIFHQNKPNRSSDNTKNPTITSNSYGPGSSFMYPNSGYYFYRKDGSGTGSNAGTKYSSRSDVAFLNNITAYATIPEFKTDTHAAFSAGDEAVNAGVILVVAAGNYNQKLVQSDHPDYNNYYVGINSSPNTSYLDATGVADAATIDGEGVNGATYYKSTNRPGYLMQFGMDKTTTPYTIKPIIVGGLDFQSTKGLNPQYGFRTDGKERKWRGSTMGNAVDCFAFSQSVLCASAKNSGYNRYDAYYTVGSNVSAISKDRDFNGTSAACPIAAGLIATKLEHNRNWTYADIKNWLKNDVGEASSNYVYNPAESSTANDCAWNDKYNFQGAPIKIIHDAAVSTGTLNITGNATVDGDVNISS